MPPDAPWLADHRRAPQGSPPRGRPPLAPVSHTHTSANDGGGATAAAPAATASATAAVATAATTAAATVAGTPPPPLLSVTQRRILYRASQRGWLELDVLLGKWAAATVPAMRPAALAETEALLSRETPELYRWVAGQERPPPDVAARCGGVLASIRTFVEGGGGSATGIPTPPAG